MTNDNYHMPICIGISIGISIAKIFSSVLGIKSIEKSGIGPPLVNITTLCDAMILMLYILLESINLMLLKVTRWA